MFASEKRVDDFGTKQFERMKAREFIETDPDDNAFVQCVVHQLATQTPGRTWEAVIFKNDDANAFALPGNKIGINTGLLRVTVNQDQLAAVLGHEMGHVLAQHGRERMSQQSAVDTLSFMGGIVSRANRTAGAVTSLVGTAAEVGILYPFTQMQENEADMIGLNLLAQAGFKPKESVEFWKNMDVYAPSSRESILSGHPTNATRAENLSNHLSEAEVIAKASVSQPTCHP
jgi:predicted Zn-dependent protease